MHSFEVIWKLESHVLTAAPGFRRAYADSMDFWREKLFAQSRTLRPTLEKCLLLRQ